MLAKLAPWQTALLNAAEIIERDGWFSCSNPHRTSGRNPACAVVAIFRAVDEDDRRAGDAIDRFAVSRGLAGAGDIAKWNNTNETTAVEVIKALKDAALT